jgi:capsular exopolysaccharide synthesis family protein
MDVVKAQPTDASFRDFLEAVKRQRWVVIISLVVAAGAGLAAILLVEPTYQSSTRIVVEGRSGQQAAPVNTQDPLFKVTAPIVTDIPTQLEQIQSGVVVSNAVQTVIGRDASLTPKEPGDPEVSARQVGLTNVIEVTVTSSNGELARRVADQLPETYKTLVVDRNSAELRQAIVFLDGLQEKAKTSLAEAETQLGKFLLDNKLSPSETEAVDRSAVEIRAEQEYNATLTEFDSETEYLRQVKSERDKLPKTIPNQTVEKNIDQIQAANQKLSDLKSERDRVSQIFDDRAVEFKQIDAQVKSQESYIASLPKVLDNQRVVRNPALQLYDDKIAESQARMKAAEARVTQRKRVWDEARARLQKYSELRDKIAGLRRQVELLKADLDNTSRSSQQLKVYENSIRNPVEIIQLPTEPKRNKPNPPLYIGFALVGGLVIAFIITIVRDRLEDKITTLDQAYRIANAPTLGYVPPRAFGKAARKSNALPSRVMENYRIVRSNVLFSLTERPFKSMMITSTGAGEGKSEVASNLAIAMAGTGKSVLLVDANMHRPAVHERFSLERGPGLSDLLSNQQDLATVTRAAEIEGLHLITAGSGEVSLADGLGSGAMQKMYREMVERYDLVIFDTPAMLPRSDALSLSATVDTVVFVVKPGATTKTLMRYCIELLRHAHARLLGVVFTNTEFYSEDLN